MTLEELTSALVAQTYVAAEGWYYLMTGLMVAIHVGFLMYEVGASRMKNAVSSGVKNLLAFAFMIPTFWLFGWYIYLAFPHGLVPMDMEGYGVPWNVSMGPMLSDQLTGVFWAAFTLFACTTASVFSGAVIERIRISSFVFLAVLLGSVCWNLGASWGWHFDGWLVTQFGYHDVAAAGVVHMIAGWFAFGVILNLGPRVGRYNADGTMNELEGHDLRFSFVGLLMIIVGFFGFLGACLIWPGIAGYEGVYTWTTIYFVPATMSSFAYNTLMGLGGGMIGAFWISKGNPFWMMSGGLAGIFSCAAGLDVWYPGLAFVLGFVGGCIIIPANDWLHRVFKIDDPVGAVAVHGVAGIWGVLACGLFAAGYPGMDETIPQVSFMGQAVGAIVMFLVGFVPGYGISFVMKMMDWLRVPDHVQEAGIDKAELGLKATNY
ncbi:ammonium transporter [Alphaproteobacteria bacterium]|jgi:ammonia channel protein AmtB|nr:ammonium transporter [Alphaproteobacteria bacterium]MDC0967744.1 ammonium transporter [Alphaproteobacteria bacterium]